MKKLPSILFFALMAAGSCKKDSKTEAPTPAPPIVQDTLTLESIIGTPDFDATRAGFFDLYDAAAYDQADAAASSSKIDFAYNYHGGGCSTCRFFENVKEMSTRTGYVDMFSTVNNSLITNAEAYYGFGAAAFDSIHNANDVDSAFLHYNVTAGLNGEADVTNRTTDVATGKYFAFTDKNSKKGFFKISDYVANVPDGNPATLTIYIKIQK